MTKKQALDELKKTRVLHTGMLKPLGISFESFLRFSQLSDKAAEKVINGFLATFEKKE